MPACTKTGRVLQRTGPKGPALWDERKMMKQYFGRHSRRSLLLQKQYLGRHAEFSDQLFARRFISSTWEYMRGFEAKHSSPKLITAGLFPNGYFTVGNRPAVRYFSSIQATTERITESLLLPLNKRLIGPLPKDSEQMTPLPFVLMVGNHSSGKSSFINYITGRKVQQSGVAPTDDSFTIIAPGQMDMDQVYGEITLTRYYHIRAVAPHSLLFCTHLKSCIICNMCLNLGRCCSRRRP